MLSWKSASQHLVRVCNSPIWLRESQLIRTPFGCSFHRFEVSARCLKWYSVRMRQGARSYLCLFPKCSERTLSHSHLVGPSLVALLAAFLHAVHKNGGCTKLPQLPHKKKEKKKRKRNNKEMGRTQNRRTPTQSRAQSQSQTPKQTRCEPTSACTSTKGVS